MYWFQMIILFIFAYMVYDLLMLLHFCTLFFYWWFWCKISCWLMIIILLCLKINRKEIIHVQSSLILSNLPSFLATHLHYARKPGISVFIDMVIYWPFTSIPIAFNLLIFLDCFCSGTKKYFVGFLTFNSFSYYCYLPSWLLHLFMAIVTFTLLHLIKLFLKLCHAFEEVFLSATIIL